MQKSILQAALKYREMNFSVIPVQKNKKPYIAWERYQSEKAKPEQIREWWDKYANANLAIVTGEISNLNVIDIDTQKGMDALNDMLPDSLVTPVARTPGGGWHYYHQSKNGLGNSTGFIEGCDFRGQGGYIITPPSVGYSWMSDLSIEKVTPVHLPGSVLKVLKNTTGKLQTGGIANVGFDKGLRDDTLFHTALSLLKGGMPVEEVNKVILGLAATCKPPFPAKEALLKIESAVKRLQNKEENITQNVAARIKEYLFDEFDGGVFKISDLRRELGLNDNTYTVARNCIKRMVDQGLVQKHGHQLGCYRVVDRKKKTINWAETEAQASKMILPGNLHQIVTIRNGDMIAFAGFKNHNKTGISIEIVRLNLDNFKVHFFITEYRARMKRRLLDFGVDLNHPNFNAYQMDKTDYIPDKIESGPGVLNVIDHFPNLDNFYLVGKYQDEIHRALDGAICMITHQKLKPNDLDAIGGSFWRITPTLAVTLFWDDTNEYQGKMRIVKGKEPGEGRFSVNGLVLEYSLKRGREFKYDLEGWK